ncbi:MAG: response regulator [Leptospiraceae bacterium]|nr:response regulator [Leptospiraceae bacterium]
MINPYLKTLLCISIFVLIGCKQSSVNHKVPEAKNGVIDLRSWDFGRDGTVKLSGEWEFYWHQFLYGFDFQAPNNPEILGMIGVPGSWSEFEFDKKKLDGHGYATYKLKVLINLRQSVLTIHLGTISSAYSFELNGKEVLHVGKIGRNQKDMMPSFSPRLYSFPIKETENTLILRVSNFHNQKGGFWSPITIGNLNDLTEGIYQKERTEWFLIGILLIIGLNHIGLFSINRLNRSALWFGLFCFMIAIDTATVSNDFLYQQLPNHWWVVNKLEFLGYYLSIPFLTLYVYELFPRNFSKKILYLILGISFTFSAIVVLFSTNVYTLTIAYYRNFIIVTFFYMLFIVLSALRKKTGVRYVFVGGFLALFLAFVNDILHNEEIIYTGIYLPHGQFFFIFSQSYLLFTEFSNLYIELSNKNKQLIQLDKLKDEFLANTSHELRTPLNGIIGITESLLGGVAGKVSEVMKTNLFLIYSSSRRLTSLVNDILDFQKLKNQDITLRTKNVDIKTLIDIVITLSQQLISKKDIKLISEIPNDLPELWGDENRIQQILFNLIDNAIKFTQEGEVRISATLEKDISNYNTNDFIKVTISDTGIGIPDDKKDDVFKSFEQLNSSIEREYGGTGLGLAITKKLVELHGGKIWLESQLGKGTQFFFAIPVTKHNLNIVEKREDQFENKLKLVEAIEIKETRSTIDPNLTANLYPDTKILVIDDEPINLQVLQNHLSLQSYEVITASDGLEGLKKMEEYKPDLILLDLMMPKMSGYEVAKEIRKNYPANILPIIILTAKNQIDDLVKGFNSGANDYLNKPFSKKELLSRVRVHIELKKNNDKIIQLKNSYSRFVPPEYLTFLKKENITQVNLGDQVSSKMAILFSDIRSFTTISESMTPAENFRFVNDYFHNIGPVIRKYNGIIIKYMGDAINAIFPGGPIDAIRAGLDQIEIIKNMNKARKQNGLLEFWSGIGVNTGYVMMGIVGEENRMQGDAFSDNVNTASRLEGLTKYYGCTFIISQKVYDVVKNEGNYTIRYLDSVVMKGKTQSINVYEIVDAEPDHIRDKKIQTLDKYKKAVKLFQNKVFEDALEIFEEIHETNPHDKSAELYIEKITNLYLTGIPDDWNAVQVMAEK